MKAPADSRGRRYPASVLVRAGELRAAGWSVRDVARIIEAEHGSLPAQETIMRWTTPGYADRRRPKQLASERRTRASRHSGRLVAPRGFTPPMKQRRIEALRGLGLSCRSIALVMAFDFGEPWSEEKVRYRLGEDAGRRAA